MHGYLGAHQLLAAMAMSVMVFWPEWKSRVQAGPGSALFGVAAILVIIGFIAATGISYR